MSPLSFRTRTVQMLPRVAIFGFFLSSTATQLWQSTLHVNNSAWNLPVKVFSVSNVWCEAPIKNKLKLWLIESWDGLKMLTFFLLILCLCVREGICRQGACLRTHGAAGCAQVALIQDQRSLGIQEITLSPNRVPSADPGSVLQAENLSTRCVCEDKMLTEFQKGRGRGRRIKDLPSLAFKYSFF